MLSIEMAQLSLMSNWSCNQTKPPNRFSRSRHSPHMKLLLHSLLDRLLCITIRILEPSFCKFDLNSETDNAFMIYFLTLMVESLRQERSC